MIAPLALDSWVVELVLVSAVKGRGERWMEFYR